MKTSELKGRALDWAVAKALGWVSYPTDSIERGNTWHMDPGTTPFGPVMKVADWRPSTAWSQGGPLIEQHGVEVFCNLSAEQASRFKDASPDWRACMNRGRSEHSYGPTPLIAAMRCLVAAKLGDTVQVPAELLTQNP